MMADDQKDLATDAVAGQKGCDENSNDDLGYDEVNDVVDERKDGDERGGGAAAVADSGNGEIENEEDVEDDADDKWVDDEWQDEQMN